jgi:hypothetical protein
MIEIENGIIPNNQDGILISKLCGALASDGTIYKQDKIWNEYPETSYYFELADEWKESVALVSEWIEKIINKKGAIKPYRGSFRYRIGSKKLVSYLHSLGFSYGCKAKTVSIPKEVLSKEREFQLAFITGVLIFDGTVKMNGTTEFCTISKKLRDQMVEILKKENIHLWTFKTKMTKWSSGWKYGFSSRSFDFFMRMLEGPKLKKLILIRKGQKLSIKELHSLFPLREWSKIPFIKEIYKQIKSVSPNSIHYKNLSNNISEKYKVKFNRNTLLNYLNLLVKSEVIKRSSRGWYKLPDNIQVPNHLGIIIDGKA